MTVKKFPDQYPAEKILQAEPVAGDTKDAAIVRPLLRQTELGETRRAHQLSLKLSDEHKQRL